MNKLSRIVFFAIVGISFLFGSFSSQAVQATNAVDWEKFLAKQDLVWNTMPTNWESGAFVGNGLLGTMIYASETNTLQFDIGRSDVTDKGDRVAIGRFVLTPAAGEIVKGSMRLDLWNAEARGELQTGNGIIDWRSFTHAKKLVNVIELKESTIQTVSSPTSATAPLEHIQYEHLLPVPARAQAQGQ